MEFYNKRIAEFTVLAEKTKGLASRYSWLRLLLVIAAGWSGWLAIKTENDKLWFAVIGLVILFLVVIRIHQRKKQLLEFQQTILKINQNEIHYLNTNVPLTENGSEFAEDNHAYTHDLDVFGPFSLFHHLARTGTLLGKKALATAFKKRTSSDIINGRQKATEELSRKPEFRQEFYAKAILSGDNEKLLAKLRQWTSEPQSFSAILNILRFVFPAIFVSLIVLYSFTGNIVFMHLITTTVIINLLILGSQIKKMTKELSDADNIQDTILRYSELLQLIENENFESDHLKAIKHRLTDNKKSSFLIHKLSRIVTDLASLQNGFGAIILNGSVLYHIHAYKKLIYWKKEHASHLENWMEIIGEMEVLISFANLKFNNPDYCFPLINTEEKIAFEELGHPLIPGSKRVTNAVSFTEQSFIVLTGSNMSGKSTFLRTLGINMILANAGSCICAVTATFQPMEILVSMRLSDSLSDSESYFFAEVKRLKEIMEQLESEASFVLLDEILRGTNSDDKRSGTIGVIENLVKRKTIGAIATHDLEVCETTYTYPEKLTNKCFEVEIISNELHFDYKLRVGICQNKSATFLMKKMGVIS